MTVEVAAVGVLLTRVVRVTIDWVVVDWVVVVVKVVLGSVVVLVVVEFNWARVAWNMAKNSRNCLIVLRIWILARFFSLFPFSGSKGLF